MKESWNREGIVESCRNHSTGLLPSPLSSSFSFSSGIRAILGEGAVICRLPHPLKREAPRGRWAAPPWGMCVAQAARQQCDRSEAALGVLGILEDWCPGDVVQEPLHWFTTFT